MMGDVRVKVSYCSAIDFLLASGFCAAMCYRSTGCMQLLTLLT